MRVELGSDDYTTLVAFAVAIALVVQTTWAIVDEGDDKNVGEVSERQRALIVRVRSPNNVLKPLFTDLNISCF